MSLPSTYEPRRQPNAAGCAVRVIIHVAVLTHQLADCVAWLDDSRDLSLQSGLLVG